MDAQHESLVKILALTDAVWFPLRRWDNPKAPANLYFARLDFRRFGVVWASDEASEAGRKAAQRMLEAMTQDGLVVTSRPRRVKTLAVRLTDAGETMARDLCGLPTILDAAPWEALAKIAAQSKRPPTLLEELWIPENKLVEAPHDEKRWTQEALDNFRDLEFDLLPALSREWVESNSSVYNAFYSLTGAGWERLDQGAPEPRQQRGRGDVAAGELYAQVSRRALEAWGTKEPDNPNELGMIGLPGAYLGLKLRNVT